MRKCRAAIIIFVQSLLSVVGIKSLHILLIWRKFIKI